jgi:DNA-binding transcriptional MerR regulator
MSDAAPAGGGSQEPGYTIDELTALSGVAGRTIRFYQAEGLLPWPERRGRISYYDDHHLERLKRIGVMQDRGLQLSAIRELLDIDPSMHLPVWEWLGLQNEAMGPLGDQPQTVNAAELAELVGDEHARIMPMLEEAGLLKIIGPDAYELPSPRIIDIVLENAAGGISVKTTLRMGTVIGSHLEDAAAEILTYLQSEVGKGFGDSAEPNELSHTIELANDRAAEAVGLMWAQILQRTVIEFRRSLGLIIEEPQPHETKPVESPSD